MLGLGLNPPREVPKRTQSLAPGLRKTTGTSVWSCRPIALPIPGIAGNGRRCVDVASPIFRGVRSIRGDSEMLRRSLVLAFGAIAAIGALSMRPGTLVAQNTVPCACCGAACTCGSCACDSNGACCKVSEPSCRTTKASNSCCDDACGCCI
jgi:hypothetical protein